MLQNKIPLRQPPRSAIPKIQFLHKINVIDVGAVFGKSCWSRIEHQLGCSNRFCAMLANGSSVDAIILRNFGNIFGEGEDGILLHWTPHTVMSNFVKWIGGECLNMKRALTFRIFLMNKARQVFDVNFWGSILRYCSRLPFGITTVKRFWCCRAKALMFQTKPALWQPSSHQKTGKEKGDFPPMTEITNQWDENQAVWGSIHGSEIGSCPHVPWQLATRTRINLVANGFVR